MLAALLLWNLGNFVFFVLAGRDLGPNDYGLVAALLAGTMVVMVPASAFQYAVARNEASRGGPGHVPGAVYRRAYREVLWMVPLVLAVVAIGVVIAGQVVDLPVGEVLVTLLVVVPMVPLFLSVGQLQAENRFAALGTSIALLGPPRPIALVVLAAVGLGVYAALGASAIAVAIAAAAAALFSRSRLRGPAVVPTEAWSDYRRAVFALAAGLGGIALLSNLDVVVAKIALPDEEAGQFGAIAVLGKAVVLVPQAVSIVVLPRVAARRAATLDTGPLLALAVGVTLVVGAAATLVAAVFEEQIVRVTFGPEYVSAAHLLAPFTAASTLLGAVIVLLNHHAGRGADAYVWGVGAVALVQPLLFVAFHGSSEALIAVDAVAYGLGIALHEVLHGRGPNGMVRGLWRLGGRLRGRW